jgi:amidase
MMTADSHNNIFGRTINPVNRRVTTGGSTGGEGALIAMRGSVLGFGTDLAGSIRIPSLCNGIYGFKPSSRFIPYSGQVLPLVPGWEEVGIIATSGPLATSMRACSFALETILKATPANFDPVCLRIPWSSDIDNKKSTGERKLRIGVAYDDGQFTPTPPMRRGLAESVEKLKQAGVAIVPLTLPLMGEIGSTIGSFFSLDGSKVLWHSIQKVLSDS